MHRIYSIVAPATGFGITRNVMNCYAAAVRLWEPGGRIYLFGFSRGAYTARCVAEVLAMCGIPRKTKDGQSFALDQASVGKVVLSDIKRNGPSLSAEALKVRSQMPTHMYRTPIGRRHCSSHPGHRGAPVDAAFAWPAPRFRSTMPVGRLGPNLFGRL